MRLDGEGVLLFGGYGACTTKHCAPNVQSMNDTWTWTPTEGWNELRLVQASCDFWGFFPRGGLDQSIFC